MVKSFRLASKKRMEAPNLMNIGTSCPSIHQARAISTNPHQVRNRLER